MMELGNVGLSLFVPLLVSLAKQSGYDDRVNRLIAIAVYAAWAGLVTVSTTGFIDASSFLTNFATTLTVGSVAYQRIFSAFGIDDTLTDWTSFRKAPVEDVVITE